MREEEGGWGAARVGGAPHGRARPSGGAPVGGDLRSEVRDE
jgi:hypothetical protein